MPPTKLFPSISPVTLQFWMVALLTKPNKPIFSLLLVILRSVILYPSPSKGSFKMFVLLSDGCPWFVVQVNICGLLEVFAFVVRSVVYLFPPAASNPLRCESHKGVFRCAFAVKAFSCQIRRKICRLRAAYVFQYRQAVFCEFPCRIIAENFRELRRKCSVFIGEVCAIRSSRTAYRCVSPSVISC